MFFPEATQSGQRHKKNHQFLYQKVYQKLLLSADPVFLILYMQF